MMLSPFADDGVASNTAVKKPVCVTKICDCQEVELTVHVGAVPVVFVKVKLAGVLTPETLAVTV
jgi:hypothetical protein